MNRLSRHLLLVLFFVASCASPAKAAALTHGRFTLQEADCVASALEAPWQALYDAALPHLVAAVVVPREATPEEALLRVVQWVNRQATPARHPRVAALGTDASWDSNTAAALVSGHLLCSEQAALAGLMLQPHVEALAVRDVAHHTFFEARIAGRWLIVDPMFDARIRNHRGRPFDFEDAQAYLAGETTRLTLPRPPSPSTLEYLDLYREERYTEIRHPFRGRIVLELPSLREFVGEDLSAQAPVFLLAEKEQPGFGVLLLRLAVCNNIHAMLSASAEPHALAARLQDVFLERIAREWPTDADTAETPDNAFTFFKARNLQLLGRCKEALALYATLPPSTRVALHRAQCYAAMDDRAQFDALQQTLADDVYYRFLHQELHGEPLHPDDPDTFSRFPYRLYTDGPS